MTIPTKESETVELKSQLSDSFLKTVSAYANYQSGQIIFGVNDDGTITGLVDPAQTAMQIEQKINDCIVPVPNYRIATDDVQRILAVIVDKGRNTPYLYRGIAYKRSHTSTRPVDRFELKRLSLDGQHLYYDSLPAVDQDLTFHVLEDALRSGAAVAQMSSDILRTLGLLRADGAYTNAGALLADRNSFVGIRWQRIGNGNNELRGQGDLSKVSILQQLNAITDVFSTYYASERIANRPERIETWDIPVEAFREAVANALVHRTWDIASPTKIAMYHDRVEITSPGGLPTAISENQYREAEISVARNPTLVAVFFRLGLIEAFGTGIRRIREAYAAQPVQPQFHVTEDAIKVILPVIGRDTPQYNANDWKVLTLVRRTNEVSRSEIEQQTGLTRNQVLRSLRRLQESGVVYVTGKGSATRYHPA